MQDSVSSLVTVHSCTYILALLYSDGKSFRSLVDNYDVMNRIIGLMLGSLDSMLQLFGAGQGSQRNSSQESQALVCTVLYSRDCNLFRIIFKIEKFSKNNFVLKNESWLSAVFICT